MAIDKKYKLPFKIIGSSSVTGGYTDVLHTTLGPGTEITNWHRDTYGKLDEAVLQSPFTEQWVGGRSHRHVALNTGSDSAENRPEAFHAEFISDGVRFYSHAYRNSPPAYWSRDGLAKRPVNIANIANTDLYVGNYSKGYEYLQTTGRRLTNNLIVDGFEADGVLTNQFINSAEIRPYWYQDGQPLTSSDGAGNTIDYLGSGVGISSDGTVIVAGSSWSDSPGDRAGSLVVFKKSSLGWYQDGPQLTSNDGAGNSIDILGTSVGINSDGTVIVGGAANSDSGAIINSGSLVVFKSSSLGWYQDGPQLTSSGDGGSDGDWLGSSVAINSDGTVVVGGSPFSDFPASSAGSLIVFKSSSLGWYQDGPPLTSSIYGQLGRSTAINSDGTIIVGGMPYANGAAGRLIIFKSSSLGWYQDGPLLASSDGIPSGADYLGQSVAINSDGTVIVGGADETDSPVNSAGSLVVFKSSSLGWYQDGPQLTSNDGGLDGDSLGTSVAMNSDGTIIVGGCPGSDFPISSAGSLVVFKSSSLGWYQDGPQLTSTGDGGLDGDFLGGSTAINSDGTVIIGGSIFSDSPGDQAGSVIIFNYSSVEAIINAPYALPDLTQTSKTVIVERFNAPGSKEESSRGALDREGEEMSPNIPLPYRNIKMRQPYYHQLAQHMPQFGSGSTYKLLPDVGTTDAVTVHKVNRNRLVRGGVEYFDNWFVQHAIPRTDIQYSWITASATTTAAELGGYQSSKDKYAYNDINFVTASLIVGGLEVDNLYIDSYVKNSKTVDITTNTFSIEPSLSASFSEYTTSPYGFGTFSSLRLGDYPVARALRANNVISILKPAEEKQFRDLNGRLITVYPKRGDYSAKFVEPPVTFKYRPLEHRVVTEEGGTNVAHWYYPYTNYFSSYANKTLLERLSIEDGATTFYDVLQRDMGDDGPLFYYGHSYREIVWPKEENTGLKETRQRAEYILDQAGFDRDGYDRQLGTQRAFWRDAQADRQRSLNSEGGYVNSLGYLSTEETGSNFTQNESEFFSNNKTVVFDLNFIQDADIDSGLFNSISLLESLSNERELYVYSGSIYSQNYFLTGLSEDIEIFANINKRGYNLNISGEFNNIYNDFFQQLVDSQNQTKISLGSLYRNTGYKALLTPLPKQRSSLSNIATQTEDEEIFQNPKLKYASFIGGAELNTGSFVQNGANFTDAFKSQLKYFDGDIRTIEISGSDIYVGGAFQKIATESYGYIAKWDGKEWHKLGGGLNGSVLAIEFSGSDMYVGGSFTIASYFEGTQIAAKRMAKWDGQNWSEVGGGFNNSVFDILLSGSDIYAAGQFTTADPDGAATSASRIAKLVSGVWNNLDATVFNNRIEAIIASGSYIYAGGQFTSPGNYIRRWSGSSWVSAGTSFIDPIYDFEIHNGSLYTAGGGFSAGEFIYVTNNGTTWSSTGTGYSGDGAFPSMYSLISDGTNLYASGNGAKVFLYDNVSSWSQVGGNFGWSFAQSTTIYDLLISGSDLYAVGQFEVTGSKISKWDGANWNGIYTNLDYQTFSYDYFSQTFSDSDFSFSTMDNGLVRTTEADSGKKPFFDSYEDFIADVRGAAKDYSVIPEFRISEHMDYYVKEKGGNFRAENNSILSLDGVGSDYRSSLVQTGSLSDTFFASYLTSDLLKKEEDVRDEADCELENISVTVSGIKKLLPYNGFYPQDRTVQLANLYGDYVDNKLHGGIYNLGYSSDYFNEVVINTSLSIEPSSISVEKYGDKYFMAVGYPNISTTGRVRIYSSSIDDPTNWSSTIVKEISPTSATLSQTDFGAKVQFLSASNGFNLLVNSQQFDEVSTSITPGYLLICSSSDGVIWSDPEKLQIFNTTDYISGTVINGNFGTYFDFIYEQEQQKIIIATSDITYYDGANYVGAAYIVTASMVEDQWQWSQKNEIHRGTINNDQVGRGISILSCSSGYQVFFAEPNDVGINELLVATSADGENWNTPVVISQGTNADSLLGINNISAENFNGKSYVFFSEPQAQIYENGDEGAVYAVTSSENNAWPSSTTYLDKKLIYTRNLASDLSLAALTSYSIETFVGNDNRLYYVFGNKIVSNELTAEFVIGYVDSDGNFQDYENTKYFLINNDNLDAFNTVAVTGYYRENYYLPLFFTDVKEGTDYNIKAIKNNIFTEFTLKVSGSEKYYKHAALEPFFAPGILYNTIKSGIAVDWPCATGSNTSIQPYGSNSIVNAYYPQSFQMASYSGSVVQESAYGQLRSNIDYRIPFERLIFPDDAFEAKRYQETDLVEVTPIEALSADSEIVKFIDKNYIYGGYEPYISPVDFSDIDNTGPKRFSVPFVYRKQNATDSGLYSLAMSNFLAETVRFFLQDEKMVTFTSKPERSWPEFKKATTYYMDIVVEKSPDLITMEAWHSDLHPTGSNGQKMNGRYFGYPINKTDKELWGAEEFTADEARLIHNDPAYAPYTPPYFEGEAITRIAFTPEVTRQYTLTEIFSNATIENVFTGVELGATTGSDAYVNAMPVESSVDIFGFSNPVNVTIDETTGQRTVQNTDTQNQWVISPYMETPVLDFSNQSLVSYQNSYSKTSGFGRGMWSGYGEIPAEGKSINISLRESFPSLLNRDSSVGSLLQQVGFLAESKPVGQLADSKMISEAVVLIPYVETPIGRKTVEILDDYHFIGIDETVFRTANIAVNRNQVEEPTSITQMIEVGKKYVLPPKLNFLQYWPSIKPFVMYIVEFEHVLDQQDLADIWQGLMPEISYTAEMENVSINHPTGQNQFFHGEPLPTNLRWMVFKVKKKAEADYFKVTADTSDDDRFNFNKIIGREQGTDIYSYNWPYDFFSLVEFAKVELKLDYKKKE